MAINEEDLENLEPKDNAYKELDGGGLFIEVLPNGDKFWRLRYQLAAKENITLGKYPTYSLAEARQWRDDCRVLIKQGISPRALKRGNLTPDDVKPEAKELANIFLNNWCWATVEKNRIKKNAGVKKIKDIEEIKEVKIVQEIQEIKVVNEIEDKDTLEAFAQRLDEEIAELDKAKHKKKEDVAVTDAVLEDDEDKDLDTKQVAPRNSNLLKRLFDYVRRK